MLDRKPLEDAPPPPRPVSFFGRDMPVNLAQWCVALVRPSRAPIPRFPKSALAGIVIMLGAAGAAMFFLDVPAVEWARHLPRGMVGAFEQITNAGLSGWYLIPSGIIVLLLAALASPRLPRFTWAVLTALAARCGFFFLAVAVPGLVTTFFKHVLGRARPYIEPPGHPFTFIGLNLDSNYESLPSGHGTTAASVAVAIGALFPRMRWVMWLYVLIIMFSRIVLMAHHVSDVLAGALVGTLFAALVRRWFAARRLVFSPRDFMPYPGPSLRRIGIALRRAFSS
jgi:membrane-associated phospholipid phosphatase